MKIELKEIIESALPLVEKQVGDSYDADFLEEELRYNHPRPSDTFKNVLPETISNWAIDNSQIVLIEVICHDLHARAIPFESVSDMENHLLGPSSFLNMFCTYVIPIVNGRVVDFEVYTSSGDKIVKHVFDETSTVKTTSNCKIEREFNK